jgi:hypothetical protein
MFKSTSRSFSAFITSVAIAFLLTACNGHNKPVRGFVLPPGNVEAGKQVFIKYGCFQCHTLPSVTFPEREPNPPITLEIGGKVYRVRDYGELLDAVVSPNHIISPKYRMMLDKDKRRNAQSPMPNYNKKLTVAELIDLVAFLHDQYMKMDPPNYRGYSVP